MSISRYFDISIFPLQSYDFFEKNRNFPENNSVSAEQFLHHLYLPLGIAVTAGIPA